MDTSSHFSKIKEAIIQEITYARHSIYVAVAWFTDKELFEALIEKCSQGLDVQIIYYDDSSYLFSSPLNFSMLKAKGGSVYPVRKKLMHNKYCIIDRKTVITGSFNWTVAADKSNLENIQITRDDFGNAKNYLENFVEIIKTNFQDNLDILRPLNEISLTKKFESYPSKFQKLCQQLIIDMQLWEQVLTDLQTGFFSSWLTYIGEISTYNRFIKNKRLDDDLESVLVNLIYRHGPKIPFTLFGIEISPGNVYEFLKKVSEKTANNEEQKLTTYLLDSRLCKLMLSYNNAVSIEEENYSALFKSLKWLSKTKDNSSNKLSRIIRYFEWKYSFKKFIYNGTLKYSEIDSLLTYDEYDKIKEKYIVPFELEQKIYNDATCFSYIHQLNTLIDRETLTKEIPKNFIDILEYCSLSHYTTVIKHRKFLFDQDNYIPPQLQQTLLDTKTPETIIEKLSSFLDFHDKREQPPKESTPYKTVLVEINVPQYLNLQNQLNEYAAVKYFIKSNLQHSYYTPLFNQEMDEVLDLLMAKEQSNSPVGFLRALIDGFSFPAYNVETISKISYLHLLIQLHQNIPNENALNIIPTHIKQQLFSQQLLQIKEGIECLSKYEKTLGYKFFLLDSYVIPQSIWGKLVDRLFFENEEYVNEIIDFKTFFVEKSVLDKFLLPENIKAYLYVEELDKYKMVSELLYSRRFFYYNESEKPILPDREKYLIPNMFRDCVLSFESYLTHCKYWEKLKPHLLSYENLELYYKMDITL